MPLTPLGFYDHPPDPDVPGLRGVNVGGGRVVGFGQQLTRLVDELTDFLDAINPLPP